MHAVSQSHSYPLKNYQRQGGTGAQDGPNVAPPARVGFLHVAKLITAGERWGGLRISWKRGVYQILVTTFRFSCENACGAVYQILVMVLGFLARLRTKFSGS